MKNVTLEVFGAPKFQKARGPAFFYDFATKQLLNEYAQYPEMLRKGSRVLHDRRTS